jgi:hypothetical protein
MSATLWSLPCWGSNRLSEAFNPHPNPEMGIIAAICHRKKKMVQERRSCCKTMELTGRARAMTQVLHPLCKTIKAVRFYRSHPLTCGVSEA